MLNAKLEHHLTGSHTLSHEDSVYIYIYIYILFDWFDETQNIRFWCEIVLKFQFRLH